MGDSNLHGKFGTGFPIFQPDPAKELEHARLREKRLAEAQAYHAAAYLEMPADLRDRAKEWGVLALMDWLQVTNVASQMRHFCAQPHEALQLLLGKLSR